MSECLSQADLDALFGDFSDPETVPGVEDAVTQFAGIRMEAGWEPPPSVSPEGGDILSQDEIDKLLAQFGA